MGRKNSNRHFEVVCKHLGLIISHVLARRYESLVWDFREFKIPVTRFFSIFVSFTPPLIFLEPLKLASWNFHTTCIDDGANSLLSHRWLTPIGAKGAGSKYGVNFGIFKNHSGGRRGGHISTGRFQIYTYGGGWPSTEFLPSCDSGEFPQPASLSFFRQNLRGYIPATPGYIDIKFAGYIDTVAVCGRKFSKLGLTPKFGP